MASGKVAPSVPIQTYSRFSLLEEDSDDSDDEKKEVAAKKDNAAKNAKKRARRKKKAAAETNELRNLAFSKPVSAKAIQNVHHERHAQPEASSNGHSMPMSPPTTMNNNLPTENIDVADWETWKNKDEEFVVNQFQRDLENALRVSSEYAPGPQVAKVKKKVKTMSLDEFVAAEQEAAAALEQAPPPVDTFYVPNGYSPEDIDPNHYDTYMDDLAPTTEPTTTTAPIPQKKKKKKKKPAATENGNSLSDVLQELHTEEPPLPDSTPPTAVTNGGCSIDAASVASYENIIDEKDKEITRLNDVNEKLKEELAQVKKRNKQFCFILAQGEMKEKSEILLQVDELTNVKNELSEELADMHTQLEQERSKVSSLKLELTKAQNQRSKTKSVCEEF